MFWRRRRMARRVLDALAKAPGHEMDTATLAERTELRPASLYPLLVHLRHRGWVTTRQPSPDAADTARRGRPLYQVSPYGWWIVRGGKASTAPSAWWPTGRRPA
ncbi:helix-turn-helix domain-containing protein [Umezawaea sp. Da 62-37]|uniref:helix-turn-helix domain-containing protein n=1 Tax=Umezawaea sp. Da 62-37 TaxID=3075927 RepID=UPI0037DDDC18